MSFDALLKHDLRSGQVVILEMEEGRVAGDLCFVPDEERNGVEDGGWLLYFTHSLEETQDKAWLEIVDAADIQGGAVATIELPGIPIGFRMVS